MGNVKQVIVVRKYFQDSKGQKFSMSVGKTAAQVAHASIAWLANAVINNCIYPLTEEQNQWLNGKFTKITLRVDTEEDLLEIYHKAIKNGLLAQLITDSGDTVFGGVPTTTCVGIGPHEASKIDIVTGHLRSL